MSTLAPASTASAPRYDDDVPIDLSRKPAGADRVFNGILAAASGIVLMLLAASVAFLCKYGFNALKEAGPGLVTDPTWSPDAHHFGMLSLLVGSIAIALLAVLIATPISLCLALMINEYAPRQLKPWLTGIVDMLATVPSIVYGFWGLLLISNIQAAPARWLVTHASFVPIFRTASPNQYVKSIFACGLICCVTIIPIITSVSREVMAQTPRDVCEAALGLGATRWGMVTDVILPFSRNGILGAVLLGVGRGLGETMIVVLVLSQGNHLTSALMGPGGLGSIAAEITENFVASSVITKSGLILLGLVLFVTTLLINIVARLIVERSNKAYSL
jgi:phosphate transport system permease protein